MMGFDLATAKPVGQSAPPGGGGFDLASAKPVAPVYAQIPSNTLAIEADPVQITEKDPATGKLVTRMQQPSGTTPRLTAAQKQANIDRSRELAAPERTWRDDSLVGNLVGPFEAGLGVLSSMVTPTIAVPGGFIKSMVSGGDPEKNASDIAERIAFRPASGTGAQMLRGIGTVAEPLAAMAPAQLNSLASGIGTGSRSLRNLAGANAAALGAEEAQMVAGAPKPSLGQIADLVRKPKGSTLAGVGSAATPIETLRVEAAKQLPVPMDKLMTKGMRTRQKPDIQFEQIAAKDPELGAGLRNRTVQVNQATLDNLDAFADGTGASGTGLVPTGKVVTDYLVGRVKKAKTEIRQAYNDAAASAEGSAPASYAPLKDYLKKYQAEAQGGNAPVIGTVEKIIAEMDPEGTGTIPVSAYNEIRERVGRMAKTDPKNSPFGKPIQDIIDAEVEAKGGPQYRSARRLYENYQNEFKNASAIDRLLRTKPGTKDRATALEDVVTKSTLDAPSAESVRQVKTTLTRKQDPEGLQAWKELQGETARQIKERVMTTSRNEAGTREVSPAALDKIIRELDADGRLNTIFSKQGAQQWRDLRDTVAEMKTIPPGTVSSSGTAEVLAGLLDTAVSGSTGLPLPIASAINYGVKRVKKNMKIKKIDRALNPDGGD